MSVQTTTETQQRILDIAKEEFLAHGFKDASLRGIVKKAGFTQGAFYGYYANKEELFSALAAPADVLVDQFKAAQQEHFNLIPAGKTETSMQLSTEYLYSFLEYVYQNFDAFKLVLCCSAGTRYENYVNDLVDLQVSVSQKYFAQLRRKKLLQGKVNPHFYHMITSAYFTAIFETVVHDMPYKKAKSYVADLVMFFNAGWKQFFTFA
ncbi:MAG: TetR/AcrR family transcriptional regulator [Eggerthellaceae bacterium]|nr:TetR/AcrR family transcriptional regulator [Eggerthellaceae bacterium]